ncbi:MAG: hypothetical protein HEQ13_04725 [Dolichospermum sp. DEX189]|nr:hypothetical protein [Dolichospermum sp. DEX189]
MIDDLSVFPNSGNNIVDLGSGDDTIFVNKGDDRCFTLS